MGMRVSPEQQAKLMATPGATVGKSVADGLLDPAFHLGEKPAALPVPGVDVSEAAFHSSFIELAERYGWKRDHTHNSRRSVAGFPDEVLVRLQRVIFAELKTETGKESRAQAEWRKVLEAVRGTVEAYLFRPSDWPRILEILK